jgi:maltose O-acetyltransferase
LVLSELISLPHKLRTRWLLKNGLKLGKNCYIAPSVLIDQTFPWLISIGDDCTLTYNVTILAHDASTKKYLNYTKIGAVTIGNRCFVGAGSIILPNVNIGNNVIIGAGSVVTHSIPDNSVVAGNPAKIINNIQDFIVSHSETLKTSPLYKKEGWTVKYGISQKNRATMWENLKNNIGYIE